MKINVIYLNVKSLKSKNGNYFYLATFALNGDPFKCVVSDSVSDKLSEIDPGCIVTLVCCLSVYNDSLRVSIDDLELF